MNNNIGANMKSFSFDKQLSLGWGSTGTINTTYQPLSENEYTITAKTIKQICIKGDQTIKIKRGLGLSMIIESHNLILCKVQNDTLFIEPYSTYKWHCCWPVNITSPNNRLEYSDTWIVNAIFIVKDIEYTGTGSMTISEGFDKSLLCTVNEKAIIIITNLNVVNLICNVNGNGKIKFIDSFCSNLNCNVNGNGYVKTPKVHSTFNCKIKGSGIVEGTKYKKCTLTQEISKYARLDVVELYSI